MAKITHKIYCWRTGKPVEEATKGTRYYLSVRPVNNPKNAKESENFSTRQGRNKRANELLKTYKGKAVIIRNTNPNKLK